MPGPRHPRPQTREQWQQHTENARREARYKHAEDRVRKIAAGTPALTDQQRATLAAILAPAGDRA
jgi:hypothetical protein